MQSSSSHPQTWARFQLSLVQESSRGQHTAKQYRLTAMMTMHKRLAMKKKLKEAANIARRDYNHTTLAVGTAVELSKLTLTVWQAPVVQPDCTN